MSRLLCPRAPFRTGPRYRKPHTVIPTERKRAEEARLDPDKGNPEASDGIPPLRHPPGGSGRNDGWGLRPVGMTGKECARSGGGVEMCHEMSGFVMALRARTEHSTVPPRTPIRGPESPGTIFAAGPGPFGFAQGRLPDRRCAPSGVTREAMACVMKCHYSSCSASGICISAIEPRSFRSLRSVGMTVEGGPVGMTDRAWAAGVRSQMSGNVMIRHGRARRAGRAGPLRPHVHIMF